MHTRLIGSLVVSLFVVAAALAQAPPAKVPEPARPTNVAAKLAIPPDAEHATKALVDSPRHGEWVEIALPAASDAAKGDAAAKPVTLKTWVSYPERSGKAPVVIVIHEIFGMTDWVRGVADQLAAEGFIAVAPDLLSGKGPSGGATDSFTGDAVRDAVSKLDPVEVTARLNAARDYATTLPSATQRTGCIGFCWGGSTTFAYATKQPKLDAAVVYYGTAPTTNEALGQVACPVLGLYGGDDARVTSTVELTTKATTELKKSYTPKVYDKAGHGFLRQQSARDGANLAAAQSAWAETIAILRKQLEVRSKE
ncbi:MAG: dienelactone hydrolase family protein [Phycisphaerae bacterium]|nr:dienelactone hydrolase family protein [Phycisphaerae bacterium]